MGSLQITVQGYRSCIMSLTIIWREPLDVKFAVSEVSQLSGREHSKVHRTLWYAITLKKSHKQPVSSSNLNKVPQKTPNQTKQK